MGGGTKPRGGQKTNRGRRRRDAAPQNTEKKKNRRSKRGRREGNERSLKRRRNEGDKKAPQLARYYPRAPKERRSDHKEAEERKREISEGVTEQTPKRRPHRGGDDLNSKIHNNQQP